MKKLASFTFCFLILCSCEDQLAEVPKNFISSANFWRNAEDAEAAVKGLYRVDLIDPFDEQFLEIHSDFAAGRGSWAPLSIWQSPMANAEIGRAATYFWNRPYQIINNTNTVIENVPDIDMAEERKIVLLAEARFLRAMQYFNL